MARLVALFIGVICVSSSFAQEIKIYWRCADKTLEAIEPEATYNDKTLALYVNYANTRGGNRVTASPVKKNSRVTIPDSLMPQEHLMLGVKSQWFMNCVGEITHQSHYKEPKLIFDVSKNAFGCPLIPKHCQVKNLDNVVIEND